MWHSSPACLKWRSKLNRKVGYHTSGISLWFLQHSRSPLLGSELQTVPAIEAACLKIISWAERNTTSPLGYTHKHTLSPPDLRSSHHRLEEQIRMDMEPLRQLFGNLFANGALAS